MSRTMIAIALALALLTGVLLGQLTSTVSSEVISTPTATSSGSVGRIDRVRAFYDGMNDYLATGDDGFLRLLSSEFQDRLALDSAEGSAATLIERLDAMRQSASPPRFTIEEIHDLGSVVEARVSTGLPATLDVAGLTLAVNPAPTTLEFVQLERNAIVARWSQDDLLPRVDSMLDAPLLSGSAAALSFDITRVTLTAQTELELPRGKPAWVLVEAGELAIDDGGSNLRVAQGESRLVTPAGLARIRNPASDPAIVLLATVGTIEQVSATILGMAATPVPTVASGDHLAWATQFQISNESDRLRVRIARVTAPPGAQILEHSSGVTEAIAVLDGQLDATVHWGNVLHCRSNGLAQTIRDREAIAAGEGVAALHDASLSYRVTSSTPATLLVLTVTPSS